MIKKNWKKIIVVTLIILCIASVSFAAYLLNATQVTYDKNGTTVTVKDALDELHTEVANAPKKVFDQGQLVTYKGEEFYALYDVSSIDTTMEIFAKTNLNQDATAQANDTYSNTKCTFSSTNYWSSLWTSGTRLNLNNVTGYTSTDVLGRVDTYARTKGAIRGRLLTYDEANTLSSFGDMIYGRGNTAQTNSSGLGYECYWLGSSDGSYSHFVYFVYGNSSYLLDNNYNVSNSCGVRPVLTVYKSEVTNAS